jgi:stage II sporulation protein P
MRAYGYRYRKKKKFRWRIVLTGLAASALVLFCRGGKLQLLGCEELVAFYMTVQEEEASEASVATRIITDFMLPGEQQRETKAYPIQTESDFSYEAILAKEAADENYIDTVTGELVINEQQEENEQTEETAHVSSSGTGSDVLAESRSVIYSREKLADFDYLIQNFYQVDNTTTITGEQLNADALLGKDVRLSHDASSPQILIYHTHSQEGYADSVEGDTDTTVVGVGEELARILTEQYGMNVLHHTGEYDVGDRDHAYSKAGPALEQILAENPSIEVVIDLHRDGVREDTRLVTEMNGVSMAQIMFFNGLSRTTSMGDIDYLYNPYIADNLAISFQMQLKAAEYYPSFTRKIYLKGYRYNMHYCPKTLLVEVGAQTNTLQEAKNAMLPLADLLHKVLTGSIE